MNATNRLIALELLEAVDPHPVATEHQLYRIAHVYRDGLTDKEFNFLMRRCAALKEETEKLAQLKSRLRKTLNGKR